MPDCEVVLQTDANQPIAWAWVYWTKTDLKRTDGDGRVFSYTSGDKEKPWNYTTRLKVAIGTEVEIYYSRGAKRIPDARMKEHADVFLKRKIEVKDAASPPLNESPAAPKDKGTADQNKLVAVPQAIVKLPDILIQLTTPEELSIWPLLWELTKDSYMTHGIAQGAGLWQILQHPTRVNLLVNEYQASPAPAAADRPRERGLHVVGKIDKKVTGVKVQILNAKGDVVSLRTSIDPASAAVQEVKGRLGTTVSAVKNFEADIFFQSAADAFGPVQIFILSEGKTPPIIDAFFVDLAGLQTALVDDYLANHNGQVRGQPLLEADEVTVVDFLSSPTALDAAGHQDLIRAQSRARRMIAYQFANENRSLDPAVAASPNILKPQMPMWMAEFQILGLTLANLSELMLFKRFRKFHAIKAADPGMDLKFQIKWEMELFWSGPDSRAGAGVYHYRERFTTWPAQVITLHFDASGNLMDDTGKALALGSQGEIPNAFATAPVQIPFPVAGRRLPLVVLSGQQRPWGRQPGAPQKDALLIEFQPKIANAAGAEILRGGNGKIRLTTIQIDGHDIDPGRIEGSHHALHAPPAADPLIALPEFRIRGRNPSRADVETAIDGIANDVLNTMAVVGGAVTAQLQDSAAFIPLAAWQETTKLVCHKESNDGGEHYSHFLVDHTKTERFGTQAFGWEKDMPMFGPPHGYGLAQRDPPNNDFDAFGCAADEIVWNFVIGIRCGIVELIQKGGLALGNFRTPAAAASSINFSHLGVQEQRAMFQRDAIRRYNGNAEFHFDGHHWMVNPPHPDNDYPNQVLNPSGATDVDYTAVPVQLAPANFGPGI
jgi:hypothetical protein